jgi:hypothetical protein
LGKFVRDLESARIKYTIGLLLIILTFTAFEYVRTPVWGAALRGEGNLWTIASGMMDFLVGIIAFACAALGYYIWRRQISRDRSWIAWLLISFAFVFFSLDETLSIHERLGKLLRREGVADHLLGLRPHNVVEAVYYTGALVLTVWIFRRLKQDRAAFVFYMGGIALMAFQTFLGLAPKDMGHNRLPHMFAEVIEMFAITCFACAFINLAFGMVKKIALWIGQSETTVKADSAEHVLSVHGVGN